MQNLIRPPESLFAVRGDRRNGIDRLSLLGELTRATVPLLTHELDGIAHAGGAVILDLRALESVDASGVRAIEGMSRHADRGGWWLFIVNCGARVREAFERAGTGALLTVTDVSDVLASGDGGWSPISLPPRPGHLASRPPQLAEDRP